MHVGDVDSPGAIRMSVRGIKLSVGITSPLVLVPTAEFGLLARGIVLNSIRFLLLYPTRCSLARGLLGA